jgi:hypothetical protein
MPDLLSKILVEESGPSFGLTGVRARPRIDPNSMIDDAIARWVLIDRSWCSVRGWE